MKKALIGIDPSSAKGKSFERFCSLLVFFQRKGLLSQASIVSVIHPALFAVPAAWYRKNERKYAVEAEKMAQSACEGQFAFDAVKILRSESHLNENLVSQMARYGKRAGSDLLVLASSEKPDLPHWVLGSFTETAALAAKIPILVLKPHLEESELSSEPRFVLAVDVSALPSRNALRWLSKAAKVVGAHVDVVAVEPRYRPFIDSLQQRKSKDEVMANLLRIQKVLEKDGVKASFEVLQETESVAHAIAEFADSRKAWMTIVSQAERSVARRLLLGSTARRLLTLTRRPFLSLRLL